MKYLYSCPPINPPGPVPPNPKCSSIDDYAQIQWCGYFNLSIGSPFDKCLQVITVKVIFLID